MTDLFSRIAERALGLAPTIQPMVTPFFAATQQQEGSDLLFETLAVETQSGGPGQAGATTQQDIYKPERSHEPPSLPEPVLSHRSNNADALEQHAPVSAAPAQPQYVRESEQPSYPEHIRHEQAPAQQPVSAYPPVSGYPHTGYPQGVPLLYTSRLASGEPGDGESPHAVGVDRTRARIVGVPLASTLGLGTDTLGMSTLEPGTLEMGTIETGTRPRATPQQTGRHTNETMPEVIQATPTVHVTIGRIEVRAVPAPASQAQPQRQHAAPKTMSLDEYLKQSGKGGRG